MGLEALLMVGLVAAGTLEVQVEAGSWNGQVFAKGTTLLVGNPDEPGRPAIRLGRERQQAALPERLEGFALLSEHCDREASRSLTAPVGPAEGMRVVAWTQDDMDGRPGDEVVLLEAGPVPDGALLPYAPLQLALYRAGQRQAQVVLETPTFPCSLRMIDVDEDGRPELVFAWLSAGGSGVTRGATVFELGED
jgi:hypothetical protein